MPLPEKEYYSLHEIALRWDTSLADIQYYATHGQLEVQAWVDIGVVNIFNIKKSDDNLSSPTSIGLDSYKDYTIVNSDELRQIFRGGTHKIRKFMQPLSHSPVEIHCSYTGYEVTAQDLVISLSERNRFEQQHDLVCSRVKCGELSLPQKSYPGRPSTMHLVRQHFIDRCEKGQLCSSLQQEADYLSSWASKNIKDCQVPKPKSIMNALRDDYRLYKMSSTSALRLNALISSVSQA